MAQQNLAMADIDNIPPKLFKYIVDLSSLRSMLALRLTGKPFAARVWPHLPGNVEAKKLTEHQVPEIFKNHEAEMAMRFTKHRDHAVEARTFGVADMWTMSPLE
jgi:hypothetical protein